MLLQVLIERLEKTVDIIDFRQPVEWIELLAEVRPPGLMRVVASNLGECV